MKKNRTFSWILLSSIFLIASAPSDRHKKSTRWLISKEYPEVPYYITDSAAGGAGMIEACFGAWSSVQTAYIGFKRVYKLEEAAIEVRAEKTPNPFTEGHSEEFYYEDDATLKHCIVRVNVAKIGWNKYTFLHEIGHCSGLPHTTSPGAVMSYAMGNNRGTVTDDDKYALSLLYPEKDERAPAGCATIQNQHTPPSSGGGANSMIITGFFLCWAYWITRHRRKTISLITLALLLPWTESRASVDAGVQGIFAGTGLVNMTFRSKTFLRVGGPKFTLGPVAYFNRYQSLVNELAPGLGMRIGNPWHLSIDGTYMLRKAHSELGKGVMIAFTPGYRLTPHVSLAFALMTTCFWSGVARKWRVDGLPFFGLELDL